MSAPLSPEEHEKIHFALDIIKATDYYGMRCEDLDYAVTRGVDAIEVALAGEEWGW